MKKIITYIQISIFLAGFNNVFSQEFAPVGAKWYYSHTWPYNCSLMTRMESTGVTEINGKACKILETKHFYCYSTPDETLIVDSVIWSTDYFYRENDKIYHYDPFSGDFEVLYDFNAMPGDTITVRDTIFDDCDDIDNYPYLYYCSSFMYTVDSTDSISVGGYQLKKLYNHSFWRFMEDRDWGFNFKWAPLPIIENIGSTAYWFGRPNILGVEGVISDLRCYEDENMFYRSPSWPEPYPCDSLPGFTPTGLREKRASISGMKIYPNPVNNILSIDLSQIDPGYSISVLIFNSFGKLILQKNFLQQSHSISLDISQLNSGIYFIQLKGKNKLLSNGKFVKY